MSAHKHANGQMPQAYEKPGNVVKVWDGAQMVAAVEMSRGEKVYLKTAGRRLKVSQDGKPV